MHPTIAREISDQLTALGLACHTMIDDWNRCYIVLDGAGMKQRFDSLGEFTTWLHGWTDRAAKVAHT